MPAILHVVEGPDSGRLFALTGDTVTIGRNAENTIVLNDVAVSGVHARIARNEHGAFTLLDNSSTNGTFLNGKEQRAADLKHGDQISIGATTFAFEMRERSRRIGAGFEDRGHVTAHAHPGPSLITVDLSTLDRAELERGYRRGLLLRGLDERFLSAEGPGEMLGAVLDVAMEAAGAPHGLVLLVDKRSGEMTPSVVKATGDRLEDVAFSKSLAYDVDQSGQGVISEADGEPVLCVPLETTSHTGGVIYLSGGGGFDNDDLEAAQVIGRRAGISLSAARWRVDFEMLFGSMIDAIMNTIQAKDVYTRGHSERVRHYSKLIGKELGLSSQELYSLTLGAALHDIGKVGMPDSVLKHNESPILTQEQMGEVRKHPVRGARILENISFLADVIPAAELHHEDWDGGGYPHGLKGEEIPLIARIVAVADTYDAITTDRPYQKGKSYEEGHAILRKIAGSRLEPRLVELFIQGWYKYRKGPARRRIKVTQRVETEPMVARAEVVAPPTRPFVREPKPDDESDPDIDDKLSQIIQIG